MNEALDIVLQAGRAIEAAHAIGVIHRDIKPENIMIRPDGYVKVLDFGLAKLTTGVLSEHDHRNSGITAPLTTEPGLIMGTVNYMSPEQVRGHDLDHRSDLWSLGVVFYELITRKNPFSSETPSDTIAAILRVIHRRPVQY